MSVLEVKGPEGLLKKEVIFDTRHENDSLFRSVQIVESGAK